MQFLRGFIHLRVEQPTRKTDTETCVTWKEKFFLQYQTNTMDHEQVFILVSFSLFDAVDIFQSNIGTLPQLQMFFEL